MPKLRSGTPSLGLLPEKSQSLRFLGHENEKKYTKLASWKNTAEQVLFEDFVETLKDQKSV